MKHFIYFNLHKKLFSCKNWKTKLVQYRAKSLYLTDCTFKVSQAGRSRVLTEKKKNVHAGVLGTIQYLDGLATTMAHSYRELYYNPYEVEGFTDLESGKLVESAEEVMLIDKQIFAKGLTYGI